MINMKMCEMGKEACVQRQGCKRELNPRRRPVHREEPKRRVRRDKRERVWCARGEIQ